MFFISISSTKRQFKSENLFVFPCYMYKTLIEHLLDPQPGPEGCYKTGSVCLSFCPSFHLSFRLSISFLGNGSLVFSETQHGVRGPYIVVCDRTRILGKRPCWAKMTKHRQKWPQNRVFGLFKKIKSLVLSRICVQRKLLWFINVLQKLHAWEKSGS